MKEPPLYEPNQSLEGAYRIAQLIFGYIQGTLSTKDHDELDEWVGASDANMKLFEELTDEANIEKTMEWYRKIDTEAALKKVKKEIGLKPKHSFSGRSVLLYAAMLVLIAGAGVFIYYQSIDRPKAVVAKNDVAPGTNKAVLTLADGRKIVLDSAGSQTLDEGKAKLVQTGGVVRYSPQGSAISGAPVYNTISVPRGGQFKIVLSDGSAVWLNSESSLKYPVVFDGSREVELEGEGYFEVSKALTPGPSPKGEGRSRTASKAISFSVNINGARVEVLGTHFNVNSYANEEGSKVVLVEGKVRVGSKLSGISDQQSGKSVQQSAISNQRELRPGEAAAIGADGSITVDKTDTYEAIAWTKGRFYFRDATIKNIMQQLQRWYDIEVGYEDSISYHFNAPDVPKGMPLSQVLKVLELTKKVQFTVDGKVVRVRAGERQ